MERPTYQGTEGGCWVVAREEQKPSIQQAYKEVNPTLEVILEMNSPPASPELTTAPDDTLIAALSETPSQRIH